MPGYREHQRVGGPVGGLTALGFAADQPPALALVEALGGWWAGEAVSTLPDVFEPGTSSHHRGPAHSLSVTAYGSTVAFQQTREIQNQLRFAALQCFQTAQLSQNGLQQIVCGTFGLLLHFAAGALPAIPASYASHVLLDAATPRGVPVLIRGF
jgi:membrane-bound metal-dependent hydrolase YbcI (DUF457 family)